MRILPAALAISAALHGAAVAWVQSRPKPEVERKQLVTIEAIQILPPSQAAARSEAAPTEVTLLDDHTVVSPARVASTAGNTRRGKSARISTSHGATTLETAPPAQPEPARNRLMTMRHPKLKVEFSKDFWAKFNANTKPLQPKDIAGEQLAAEIATAEANLKNPKWVANATPEELAMQREELARKRYEQSTAELKPDGAGTKAEHKTFNMKFNPDGTVARIDDRANFQRKGLGGTFDVSDAMMRRQGIDPYASYKLKVLDDTRDERAAIGKRYRTQQLARSREYVQKHLDRLWAMTQDLGERKQGLFELWDDCAETGSEELVEGGRAAREQVIGFIRSKLPATGPHAYTSAELAHFNKQRKSRASFSPYE